MTVPKVVQDPRRLEIELLFSIIYNEPTLASFTSFSLFGQIRYIYDLEIKSK